MSHIVYSLREFYSTEDSTASAGRNDKGRILAVNFSHCSKIAKPLSYNNQVELSDHSINDAQNVIPFCLAVSIINPPKRSSDPQKWLEPRKYRALKNRDNLFNFIY